MSSFFALFRDGLFIFAVIFIWLMLLYQFILTVGGVLLWRQETRRQGKLARKTNDGGKAKKEEMLPSLSVLIPARNESLVVGGLLECLLSQDYPPEKMEIVVVNDGSTDNTAEIVSRWISRGARVKLHNIPLEKSGRGKGAALNEGLKLCQGEVLAVYDADNLPETGALRKLVLALKTDPKLAAVSGKFRAYNRHRNFLTRLINIESVAFQWIIQAGRYFFLKIAFLPGTNYVIWRQVLESLGGWEEAALTEDSELTLRIYEAGYRVRFLPQATTWEQEPEKWLTWIRQRTRWARGNSYLIRRQMKRIFRARPSLPSLEIANLFYLYYLFISAIIVSDIFFILSLLGVISLRLPGPYLELWGLAFFLFILEIMVALSIEREDTLSNFGLSLLGYLTYTKLWALVVIRSFYEDIRRPRKRIWLKTERFPLPAKPYGAMDERRQGESE